MSAPHTPPTPEQLAQWEQERIAFLADLLAVCRKHQRKLTSCGCCNSITAGHGEPALAACSKNDDHLAVSNEDPSEYEDLDEDEESRWSIVRYTP